MEKRGQSSGLSLSNIFLVYVWIFYLAWDGRERQSKERAHHKYAPKTNPKPRFFRVALILSAQQNLFTFR